MYQTNMQYNVFVNYYQDYIAGLGFDLSTQEGVSSFMKTAYDNQRSFGQMLLEGVVNSIQEQYIILDLIDETGFQIDEQELEETYTIQLQSLQKAADEAGYDLDDFAGIYYGTTFKAIEKVIRQTLRAQQYISYLEEQNLNAVTDERARSYYDSVDSEGNLIKDDIDKVTVVTVLKRTVDSQLQPLAEDVVAAARAKAEQVLEMAKNGQDIYELAELYSDELNDEDAEDTEEVTDETEDSVKPGEFTFTKNEVSITDLSQWAFKASIGDIELLETDIGFIVIKLIGRTDYEDVKDDVFKLIAGSDYELKMNEYQQMSEYEVGLYRPYQDLYLNYSIAQ
ncbi:MAG: peptidylprolyl isomerase [Clostridia bacterium]